MAGSSTRMEPAAALRGIGETRLSLLVALQVQPLERAAAHDHLAADFEGRLAGVDAQGQRANGAGVLGDVLALGSVAPRDRLVQDAVPIVHRHGKAVQLQLGDVAERRAAQQFADAAIEVAQFGLVERVVQAQHRRAVPHLDETLAGLAADPLRWANRP